MRKYALSFIQNTTNILEYISLIYHWKSSEKFAMIWIFLITYGKLLFNLYSEKQK